MMTPQAAKPIAATLFANSICLMCWVQSETLSRRPNNSLIYFHNKNGKSWLPWHRPGDKRSELQLLYCLKAKKLSAIALTRSARWNQISAFKRDQLYRRSPKIQLAACGRVSVSAWRRGGVAAWRRGGVGRRGGVAAWRRGGVAAWRRGGVAAWRRGGVAAWRRGGVAAWRRGGVWACGRVGVWACGRVGVWACGRVGVWACGRVGVSPCRRGGVCYPEGVQEPPTSLREALRAGLSPGWRLCGALGQMFLSDLPCRGSRFSARLWALQDTPLPPCFLQIRTNQTRGSSNLNGQNKSFVRWKLLG
jgi:hypothetical protein